MLRALTSQNNPHPLQDIFFKTPYIYLKVNG